MPPPPQPPSPDETRGVISGGGTIWVDQWQLNLNTFTVQLSFDEWGIKVAFPSGRLTRAALQAVTVGHKLEPEDLHWKCPWDQCDHVLLAHRSVLVVRRDDSRCRFKANIRKDLKRLHRQLVAHDVPVRRVRTTLFSYLRTS